jgi:hypothetical protein
MQVNTVQTKIDGDLFGKLRNCEYLCNQKSIGYGCIEQHIRRHRSRRLYRRNAAND